LGEFSGKDVVQKAPDQRWRIDSSRGAIVLFAKGVSALATIIFKA
jgi:hypothetical protein